MKFEGASLMVQGAIKDGTKVLIRIPDRLNANGYNDVLKKGLLKIYSRNDIFQQDNDPCHKSRVISSFMDNYGICCLSDWPTQSPDLNIIESLWSDLKGSVGKCRPANIEDLWRTCQNKWARIPVERIRNLYESLPRRIVEVIKMKGKNTYY